MARGKKKSNGVTDLSCEVQLWRMADALRNIVAAAGYKHVVLGFTFLKYISNAFEAKRAELAAQLACDLTTLSN
jgi:type I restriction enzyme M protein